MPSKILVIDDERPTLSMFRLFLEAYGYEVFAAENGPDGIDLCRTHAIPLVLTDIRMPGMDGMEVLRLIKEDSPATEVIVITGHGDMDLALKALSLGATDFINKPIRQSNMDAALKRAEERILYSRDTNTGYAVSRREGIGMIELRGIVNSVAEKRLDRAFSAALEGSAKLIVSFAGNTAINGAGMALLTQHLLSCRDNGTPVVLAEPPDSIRKSIEMAGLEKLAPVHVTVEEALANI
ncbi:MAG: response regulator [Pseudodesulfovibrio sp.]|uniref:response regulator n=1 Tax=Pseudodesulfovibrio sp. TaxID=2035812 RepID=UPI003D09AD5F